MFCSECNAILWWMLMVDHETKNLATWANLITEITLVTAFKCKVLLDTLLLYPNVEKDAFDIVIKAAIFILDYWGGSQYRSMPAMKMIYATM